MSPTSNPPKLRPLNPEQSAARDHRGTPLLIVAGAGSGKTETVAQKVLLTLQSGVAPERICMMTFTNKAADNMIQRISPHYPDAVKIVAGTFHGIAYRMLNEVGLHNGYYKGERILGGYQIERMWEKAYQTVFSESERREIKEMKMGGLNALRRIYSKITTQGIDKADMFKEVPESNNWDNFKTGCLELAFTTYATLKLDYNGFDFDDILIQYYMMLQHKVLRKEVQDKFDHFFVDEYQDTSWIQGEILKSMVGDNPNVTAVGDQNQGIYSFLAATIHNIETFSSNFKNTTVIKLNRNYRSIPSIITLSNTILDHNKERIDNPLLPVKGDPTTTLKPIIHKFGSAQTEALGVIRDIKAAIARGKTLKDIAILSRLSFTTRFIEMELARENINFVKVGGVKITDKLNIRQFLAFLELTLNKYNWLAWEVILPMIPLIGKELTSQIVADIAASATWTWSTPPAVSLGAGKRWKYFKDFWDILAKVEDLKTSKPETFMRDAFILFSKLYIYYWTNASEAQRKEDLEDDIAPESGLKLTFVDDPAVSSDPNLHLRLAEIEEYIVKLAEQRPDTLQQLLDQFHLRDTVVDGTEPNNEEHITVSTIHSAKGLEWPVVFVVGLEQGTLPVSGRQYGKIPNQELLDRYPNIKTFTEHPYLEEESRLFYVAVTRAEEELHITYAAQRLGQGMKDSPFIVPFKPKTQQSGLVDLGTHFFILEKMRTEEDGRNYVKK